MEKKQAATSFDVAKLAGVSRAVVSRAFTPGSSISDDAREKVLKAASELDYRVNQVARALNRQRSDLVGLVVSNLTNPYRSAQVDALSKCLIAEGFRPMLFCIDDKRETEQAISLLLNYSVSGVVVTSGLPPESICAECARRNVPLVIIDRGHNYSNVDQVTSDNSDGGYRAAKLFEKEKREHFVVVQPETLVFSVLMRLEGFRNYAKERGIQVTTISVPEATYASGQIAGESFTSLELGNSGVFCPTDLCALGFLDLIRHRSCLEVPRDLGIIGYDDIPQASWKFANLTTFRQPVGRLAETTVELLKNRFAEPDRQENTLVLPVELIMRGTTL